MNVAVFTALFLIVGYLSGSVLYAVIVTRLVTGKDIREIGNGNPGTSNVGRSVGRGWGVLVAILDALKGVVPMLVARLTVLTDDRPVTFLLLYCIGIAAVIGHARPVFFGFKGGGGIGTMQGVSLFMVPVEYLASMLAGGILILLTVHNVQFRLTRWVPIAFTIATPLVTLATSLWLDIPLFAHISIGGHNWGVVSGAFAMSLMILALDLSVLRESKDDLEHARHPSDHGV
jgi:glycerol-3-phosphate acyltransferase PlsY